MRIQRLEIENFRCIQKFSLDFTDPRTGQPSPFAAIVGPNGTGKTAALELVAKVLRYRINNSDLSSPKLSFRATLTEGHHLYVNEHGWVSKLDPGWLDQQGLWNCLFVPASRDPWMPVDNPIQPGAPPRLPMDLALSTSASDTPRRVEHIHRWLFHERLKSDVPALWEIVERYLYPIKYAGINISNHDLLFDVDGKGTVVGFNDLSSGQRKLIFLLAEVIHHCDGKGILLLDEPESHFHPQWQRALRESLTALLPEGQVIVATHSPFVIHGIPSHELFVIQKIDEEAP